jgi:predicted dehydrogenase
MNTTKKIRWGVLGYARIAYEHVIPAIMRSSNSVFHALASRDAAKLEEGKKKFNCPNLHNSYDALLRDPEVDAIYIPLPNSLHREWTIKAAEHGKHVLCEKPIALNAAECREMIAACKKHNVVFMEAFMYRYSACTQKVLQVLRSGVLGDIKFIYATFRFPLTRANDVRSKPELGGGSLYDVGCYPLNFVGMVMDEMARIEAAAVGKSVEFGPAPSAISAQATKEGGVDVLFAGLLKYPNGFIASISSGFNAAKQLEAQIIGTKGVLHIPEPFFEAACELTRTVEGVVVEKIPVPQSDRYRLQVEDFAEAIMNKRAPYFSLVETQRNMEIMDKLYEACE